VTSRAATEEAQYRMLAALDDRRQRLGLVGLSEAEAELRCRALEKLNPEQFMALVALEPAEAREGQINALVAGQRRSHSLRELRAVARSELDDRLLFRWWCGCGAEASGDYFSAADARSAWAAHAGVGALVEAEVRPCAAPDCATGPYGTRGSFKVPKHAPNKRFCCDACRSRARDAERPKPALMSTEED
jgi:hypothetical protein